MGSSHIQYEEQLRVRISNPSAGKNTYTDGPLENQGKGEFLSPTDLAAAALGSCMLTVMAIYAGRHNISLAGIEAEVSKEMARDPVYRLGQIQVVFKMPSGIAASWRLKLEKVAQECPVGKSFHPDIKILPTFQYPD